MNAREHVLAALARTRRLPVELPPSAGPWTTYPDPVTRFCEALEEAAGRCLPAADLAELLRVVEGVIAARGARNVHSSVPEIEGRPRRGPEPADADLDLAILPGELAVAENGAVWVTDAALARRAVAFLAAHLVLVVPRAAVVHNLHEAYACLAFDERGFGTFIAGPSKTADIEQTLVIGAHGPRSLTVVLLGDPGDP